MVLLADSFSNREQLDSAPVAVMLPSSPSPLINRALKIVAAVLCAKQVGDRSTEYARFVARTRAEGSRTNGEVSPLAAREGAPRGAV